MNKSLLKKEKKQAEWQPLVSDLIGLRWALRIFISKKFPGGHDTAYPGTTL